MDEAANINETNSQTVPQPEPRKHLLYGILLTVIMVPIITMVWLFARGNAAEQHYREALAAAAARDYKTAMREFEAAGNMGHAEACCYLGMIYLHGMQSVNPPIAEQPELARHFLELAALRGSAQAEYELGGLAEREDPPDFDAAALHYRRAALSGHIEGLAAMARLHEQGLGVNKSELLAIEFYTRAAEAENVDAIVSLGEIYADKAQWALAEAYFKSAVKFKDGRGFSGLGYIYENRTDEAASPADAEKFYRQAVELDDPRGMVNLADMLKQRGEVAEALQLIVRAAEKLDYAPAWQRLGMHYFNFTPPDYSRARKCFERAASQGNSASFINLGVMSELGYGGKADLKKARQYYLKAQQLGHPAAAERLKSLDSEK